MSTNRYTEHPPPGWNEKAKGIEVAWWAVSRPSASRRTTQLSIDTSQEQEQFVGSLDCGTSSIRFIIFDRKGEVVAEHQEPIQQYYPEPGWHEQDPGELHHTADLCIEGALNALADAGYDKSTVKAIGITNQRETTIVWSRTTGRPLCRAIVWTDCRTKDTVTQYEKKLEEEGIEIDGVWRRGDEGREALRQITGLQLSTYFPAIKLRWTLDHVLEVKAAHERDDLCFGTVESWLLYNLTGGPSTNLHLTEVSNASRTLLVDTRSLQWSDPLLDFFDIRKSCLPRIVSSSEIYDTISSGSLVGVPISGMIGDQQGALIGHKCLSRGEAKCTYGTGAFLLFNTGRERVGVGNGLLSTVAYQAGPGEEPQYALEGSISVAGSSISWLLDKLELISDPDQINLLASEVSSSEGLYFVPAFTGLLAPYWDPCASGLLIGISHNTTKGHIARATLEAMAFQTRAIVESMKKDAGKALRYLKVDGGVTNGELAMQILADMGGFGVVCPEMKESTALGSAILAGSAIRLFGWDLRDPGTLKDVNGDGQGSRVFEPQMEEQEREEAWKDWQRAVARSRNWEVGGGGEDEGSEGSGKNQRLVPS